MSPGGTRLVLIMMMSLCVTINYIILLHIHSDKERGEGISLEDDVAFRLVWTL